MSTDPSKVNALRKLTEAAEAIGWSVGIDRDDVWITSDEGTRVYIESYGGRRFLCTGDDVDIPVELVPLLLEASR